MKLSGCIVCVEYRIRKFVPFSVRTKEDTVVVLRDCFVTWRVKSNAYT